eukprot:1089650-Prymnesium_polylepis.1
MYMHMQHAHVTCAPVLGARAVVPRGAAARTQSCPQSSVVSSYTCSGSCLTVSYVVTTALSCSDSRRLPFRMHGACGAAATLSS